MFNDKKVLQIISYLLSLNDNKMEKLKLMKELYLIDRMAIDEKHQSISEDTYFSLKHGPVLSNTLNIINEIPEDNDWAEYLKIEEPYNIVSIKPFDEGRLSKNDMKYIKTISDKYKNYSSSQLRNYTHTLPEWKEPHGSNRKIYFSDIMKALGKTEQQISDAKKEYGSLNSLYTAIGAKWI